jgi:PAS domain-containing protein
MAFWLLDIALDDFFVLRRSPLTFWFFEASPHEIFRRLTTFGTILLFGALIFRYAFFLNLKGGQEKLLRESEARFRTLVQTAGSVILLLSPDGLILEFNQEAERISGTQRHEALGKNAINYLIPEKFQAQAQNNLQYSYRINEVNT